MPNLKVQPRVTSFAPQFLVDDLVRSMTYYQKLGFNFGEPWDGFYVIRELDGLELHLKDFYIEDPDGYIIAFGGRPSAHGASQEPPCL